MPRPPVCDHAWGEHQGEHDGVRADGHLGGLACCIGSGVGLMVRIVCRCWKAANIASPPSRDTGGNGIIEAAPPTCAIGSD